MPVFSCTRRVLGITLCLVTLATIAQGQEASPRDTARATIGGAHLLVDYGRPSKRGREIFGGLEPWGRPWRTGANKATHFVTDKALAIGGTVVPAGTYTLYTLPISANAWKLIISKRTEQWGIPYPEGEDLVRLDMTVTRTPAVVETLEIRIDSEGGGGVLRIRWDRTEASIPFTVRP